MVRALDTGSYHPGSSPAWVHCAVFLGDTICVSLHPGAQYKWELENLMLEGSPTIK